ncbi:hypothetical protein QOT17_016291 [Balamuthia mandrillaris]
MERNAQEDLTKVIAGLCQLLLSLLARQRKQQLMLALWSNFLEEQEKKIRRWRWKLGKRKRREKTTTERKKQKTRGTIDVFEHRGFELYPETGLYPEQFYDLLAKVEPLICQPRTAANVGRITQTMMTTETRLVMVLNWLREGGTYRRLA